jgi:hypothetical protein
MSVRSRAACVDHQIEHGEVRTILCGLTLPSADFCNNIDPSLHLLQRSNIPALGVICDAALPTGPRSGLREPAHHQIAFRIGHPRDPDRPARLRCNHIPFLALQDESLYNRVIQVHGEEA